MQGSNISSEKWRTSHSYRLNRQLQNPIIKFLRTQSNGSNEVPKWTSEENSFDIRPQPVQALGKAWR